MTFVFLNPLLTLIYFVFGFLLSFPKAKANEQGGSSQSVPISLGSAVAIVFIGVVLVFFELPLSRSKRSESIVLRSATQNEARSTQHDGRFQAHIGTINARNNIQTLSSTSAGSGARVSMQNILII